MGKTFGATTAAMLVVSIGLVAAPKDQTEKFHDAAMVLREIHGAPDKDIPKDLWEKASCVAVFPSLKKAAFIIGGEFGRSPESQGSKGRGRQRREAPLYADPSERERVEISQAAVDRTRQAVAGPRHRGPQ
jgi:hypothetical protein